MSRLFLVSSNSVEGISVAVSHLYHAVGPRRPRWTHLHQGHPEQARDVFDRASAASEHIGDGAGAVLATYGHGLLAQAEGDWGQARAQYTAAHKGFLTLGTPVPQGLALAGLARCDEAEADLETAQDGYRQVLALSHQVGEPSLIATALEGLGRLA